jgi:hypothetical protein
MAGPHLAEWQGTCSALSLSYELRTSSWRPVTRNPTSLFHPAKLGVCGFWPLVAPNTAASKAWPGPGPGGLAARARSSRRPGTSLTPASRLHVVDHDDGAARARPPGLTRRRRA